MFTDLMLGQSIYATVLAIPIWKFNSELEFAGPRSDIVNFTMPGKRLDLRMFDPSGIGSPTLQHFITN